MFGKFVIINQSILRLVNRHQLHSQKALVLFVVVPDEVVVDGGDVRRVEDWGGFLVAEFVFEQLELCLADVGLADAHRAQEA